MLELKAPYMEMGIDYGKMTQKIYEHDEKRMINLEMLEVLQHVPYKLFEKTGTEDVEFHLAGSSIQNFGDILIPSEDKEAICMMASITKENVVFVLVFRICLLDTGKIRRTCFMLRFSNYIVEEYDKYNDRYSIIMMKDHYDYMLLYLKKIMHKLSFLWVFKEYYELITMLTGWEIDPSDLFMISNELHDLFQIQEQLGILTEMAVVREEAGDGDYGYRICLVASDSDMRFFALSVQNECLQLFKIKKIIPNMDCYELGDIIGEFYDNFWPEIMIKMILDDGNWMEDCLNDYILEYFHNQEIQKNDKNELYVNNRRIRF